MIRAVPEGISLAQNYKNELRATPGDPEAMSLS